MKAADSAKAITRASKSNLALAFVAMSGERRRDITTFYAFCRIIDDIVDAQEGDAQSKRRELAAWRRSLREVFPGEPALAESVRELMTKYPITPEMLEEIIAGVEMDIDTKRYATFEELQLYCYRVASAVGLVSIEIFGYKNSRSRDYAVALGLALQMTNIIRDVAVDLARDRIYLPKEDMARFDYDESDLRRRVQDSRFIALMNFEAERAEQFFAEAGRSLPLEDRRAMLPAEIMRSVYQALLTLMKHDRFRVRDKHYRLTRMSKARHVAAQWVRVLLNAGAGASV